MQASAPAGFAPGYDDEIALIRSATMPVLGICGGMQLIGRAHGVGLARGEPVIGRHDVRLRERVELFQGLPRQVTLFQRHVYRLTAAPAEFDVIAASPAARSKAYDTVPGPCTACRPTSSSARTASRSWAFLSLATPARTVTRKCQRVRVSGYLGRA